MSYGTHRCPGCRAIDVSNARLACLPCWRKLPKPVRDKVYATSKMPLLDPKRQQALMAARRAWTDA